MADTAQPPTPLLSRRQRAEQRRAQIIAAAEELFSRHGYRGTGLAEVAARVGLSLPGVLHHFGSKEGLLRAVIAQRDAESEANGRRLLDLGGSEGLRGLAEAMARNQAKPEIIRLFTVLVAENVEPDAPLHDHFVQRYRTMRLLLSAGLRESQVRGEIRADVDVEAKAAEIVAVLDGLQTQWLLGPDEVDLTARVETYLTDLTAHLSPHSGSI
jgi:AcrR family transcriptional regulator